MREVQEPEEVRLTGDAAVGRVDVHVDQAGQQEAPGLRAGGRVLDLVDGPCLDDDAQPGRARQTGLDDDDVVEDGAARRRRQ